MQYLGGKTKIAKRLVAAMSPIRAGRPFWEPFCGGLSVSVALAAEGPGLVSDANPALISLYRAVADGWDPPTSLSEEMYAFAKRLPDDQPLKAFAGFGCSFGGKWFGGYARSRAYDFAAGCARGLLRDIGALLAAGCRVDRINFLDVEPQPVTCFLYLDPPYRGTTEYKGTLAFDHDRFYARVDGWSRHTDVFVSEYSMPWGCVVDEFTHTLKAAGGSQQSARTERLYHYGPGIR